MTNFRITKQHFCFQGKQLFCEHHSQILGCSMNFAVFLPHQAELTNCPVLWFLSGLTCSEENFITKSGVQRYAAEHNMIIISPDTSPRGTATAGEDENYALGTGAGFYVDATVTPWAKHYQMYRYITEELQQLISRHFPIIDAQQGITGFSMGGHGALVLGLRNPSLYKTISALAPICAPSQCPWGKNAYNAYLGSDKTAWENYDAVALIQNGAKTDQLLVDQGLSDEFLDEQLRPDLLQKACNNAGQKLNLRKMPNYDHSFYFVASVIEDHVAFHAKNLMK